MAHLTVSDFENLFAAPAGGFPARIVEKIEQFNWTYRLLSQEERDTVILGLLKRIEAKEFSIIQGRDKSRWDKGWGENLEQLREEGSTLDALLPKYLRPGQALRLWGDFVLPEQDLFEQRWFQIFTDWFFHQYLEPFNAIYEFGCGSGINIGTLSEMYPEKEIYGLDWSQPAVDIVSLMKERYGRTVFGRRFDFFEPDETLEFVPGSAVLTIGAIEQTGTEFRPFLEFLLRKKPQQVFHIEPIVEWYDPNNLVDYTGIKTQEVRNFLSGYPAALAQLEEEGKIRIIKKKRAYFGSLAHEGYSQLIWQPV
jgi:hypothetical protein